MEPGEGGRGRTSPPPREGSGAPPRGTRARRAPGAGPGEKTRRSRPQAIRGETTHGAARAERDETRRGTPGQAETRPGRFPARPTRAARARATCENGGGWRARDALPNSTPNPTAARSPPRGQDRRDPLPRERTTGVEGGRGPKPSSHLSPPALPGAARRGRGRQPRDGPAGGPDAPPGAGNPRAAPSGVTPARRGGGTRTRRPSPKRADTQRRRQRRRTRDGAPRRALAAANSQRGAAEPSGPGSERDRGGAGRPDDARQRHPGVRSSARRVAGTGERLPNRKGEPSHGRAATGGEPADRTQSDTRGLTASAPQAQWRSRVARDEPSRAPRELTLPSGSSRRQGAPPPPPPSRAADAPPTLNPRTVTSVPDGDRPSGVPTTTPGARPGAQRGQRRQRRVTAGRIGGGEEGSRPRQDGRPARGGEGRDSQRKNQREIPRGKKKSGRQENTRGPTATREGGPAPPATPTSSPPSGQNPGNLSRDLPPHHRGGPSTRQDAWPPDASKATPPRPGRRTHDLGGLSPAPGTAHSPPPQRNAPRRGVAAAPARPARTRAARRLRLGSGAGGEPLAAGEGETGRVPYPLDTRPEPRRADGRGAEGAHTPQATPPRQAARPGPAGPSPNSEGGGAGRGRRKSRRTAPTRGGPADPFPPYLPPQEVGEEGRDSCLRLGTRRRDRRLLRAQDKARAADGESGTPHEARPSRIARELSSLRVGRTPKLGTPTGPPRQFGRHPAKSRKRGVCGMGKQKVSRAFAARDPKAPSSRAHPAGWHDRAAVLKGHRRHRIAEPGPPRSLTRPRASFFFLPPRRKRKKESAHGRALAFLVPRRLAAAGEDKAARPPHDGGNRRVARLTASTPQRNEAHSSFSSPRSPRK